MKKITSLAVDYGALLSETKPQVIHSEQQNAKFIAMLEELTGLERVSPAQEVELLTSWLKTTSQNITQFPMLAR